MEKAEKLSPEKKEELIGLLKSRFENNLRRHQAIEWADVQSRLEAHPRKLWSLSQMEETGGEPDVTGIDKRTGEVLFCDCSPESPKGRRSICYDEPARKERKAHKPRSSAVRMAQQMGIELLTEQQYRSLQELGSFDTKTSSWVLTPADIREKGGALFCDNRYGHIFVYHNGADSYYGARGFRGLLRI